jgi:hypothetical protein
LNDPLPIALFPKKGNGQKRTLKKCQKKSTNFWHPSKNCLPAMKKKHQILLPNFWHVNRIKPPSVRPSILPVASSSSSFFFSASFPPLAIAHSSPLALRNFPRENNREGPKRPQQPLAWK